MQSLNLIWLSAAMHISLGAQVMTTFGPISGLEVTSNVGGTKYIAYLGIPYAKPAVRQLRFKLPDTNYTLPSNPDGSPFSATTFGPACPQPGGSQRAATWGTTISEDCLNLNVLTPENQSTTPLPVMVYVHGGSLNQGSGSFVGYRGLLDNMVSRGAILVTLNYRLGLLGFFTTGSTSFPPNLGAHDVLAALQWIRANARNFGGDPDRITLFGQSAGACLTDALALSPAVPAGLFSRIIIESGTADVCSAGALLPDFQLSEQVANALCNISLQSIATDSTIEQKLHFCLDNMDYTKFVALEDNHAYGWQLVQDGTLFPQVPAEMARNGNWMPRPTLVGLNKDDWAEMEIISLHTGQRKITDYNQSLVFGQTFGLLGLPQNSDVTQKVAARLEQLYSRPTLGTMPGRMNDSVAWLKILTDILTDAVFAAPAAQAALRRNAIGVNVTLYEFAYPPKQGQLFVDLGPDYLPVAHNDEQNFLFLIDNFWTGRPKPQGADDTAVANYLAKCWVDFAYGRQLVSSGAEAFDASKWNFIHMDQNPLVTPGFRSLGRHFFLDELPSLLTQSSSASLIQSLPF